MSPPTLIRRRKLRAVGAALVLLLVPWGAYGQDKEDIPGKPGDTVEAGAGDKTDEAEVTNICDVLNQEGTKSRKDYEEWVKDLICEYLKADFTKERSRTAFVEKVLGALRTNASRGEGWSLNPEMTVVHIVTKNPAWLRTPRSKEPERVDGVMGRRSWLKPDFAAIGLNEKFFHTPRATWADVYEVIPEAETAILAVFSLKKLADLTAAHKDGLSATETLHRVVKAVKAFRRSKLFQAKGLKRVEFHPIAPRPAVRETSDSRPDLAAARNLREHLPDEKNPVMRITDLKGNHPLGLTKPIWLHPVTTKVEGDRAGVESIEEKSAYDRRGEFRVRVTVRTWISIHAFYGVPAKERRSGKDVAVGVVSAKGEDCTPQIKEHELRHVEDEWSAWKDEVIEALRADLESRNFDGLTGKRVDIEPVKEREKEGEYVYTDVRAEYFFTGKHEEAEQAGRELQKAYKGREKFRHLIDKYETAASEKAQEFHAEEKSLDDDCRPSAVGKNFGPVKRAKRR